MTVDIVTPKVEVPRDRYSRPLVVPRTGGKAIPYTRCTTFVGCLEDTYNLARWQQRMVALGLADRPDLQLAVAAHREDKSRLNDIVEQAMDAAKSGAAATTGTALHALTEQHDRGVPLGVIPAQAQADIEAYIAATEEFTHLGIEEFVVHDGYKIGGTFDRLVSYRGKTYIADLKTGNVDYGMGKIAMQLATYARSLRYDPATHEREPLPDVDRDRAIVIHLPAGEARCRLLWVDIAAGWEGVAIAHAVRQWRTRSNLSEEITAVAVEPAASPERPATLLEQIAGVASVDELTALWRENAHEWTEVHTEAAAVRKGQLGGAA